MFGSSQIRPGETKATDGAAESVGVAVGLGVGGGGVAPGPAPVGMSRLAPNATTITAAAARATRATVDM
jgi:hypothetical protein